MVTNLRKALAIVLLGIGMAGCSGANDQDANTVSIWHWMSDRDDTFIELAKKYKAETGVNVSFTLFAPSEAYTQRVKASAQTNTLPDIYGVLGEKRDFASFIKSGFVADLTPNMQGWSDRFFEKALAVNRFEAGNTYDVKPGVYGVPLDSTTIQMVYNKRLYREAGLDPEKPPLTWEQFIHDCRVLKEKGIPRFVSGFGEIWMIDALASNFAMNIMGERKVFQTYEGKVSYTDPDWVRVLHLFKQIADEKILVNGTVTMVNKTSEQTFANERAAYSFNGSWCVNVYKGMNPRLEYAAILPPAVTSAHAMRVWGGAGGSFVVNEKSARKEAAIQFLKWLTEDAQQTTLAEQTENLPSTKGTLTKISPILSQFLSSMETATHPNVYPVHESPAVLEAFDKGIQSILIGEKKPEEVAEEVQRVKEKELSKRQ